MNSNPIIPRQFANQDVNEAIAYYLEQDATEAALGFIDELERAYAHISRHPATGSTRYAHELNLICGEPLIMKQLAIAKLLAPAC